MNPERRVAKALEDAQGILARHVEPGPRDCEQTINRLLDVLDDETVVQALKDSKMEKPTTEQLDELKRLSAIARVPDPRIVSFHPSLVLLIAAWLVVIESDCTSSGLRSGLARALRQS